MSRPRRDWVVFVRFGVMSTRTVNAEHLNVTEGGALVFTNGVLATRQVVAVFSPTSYSMVEPA